MLLRSTAGPNTLVAGGSQVEGPHDLLVTKQVNSAFHGSPDLAGWLKDRASAAW